MPAPAYRPPARRQGRRCGQDRQGRRISRHREPSARPARDHTLLQFRSDADHWRRAAITPRAPARASSHPDQIVYPDQDALNHALAGDFMPLDSRWNCYGKSWDTSDAAEIIYVAFVVAVAMLTYRWIEDPARRRFNHVAASRWGAGRMTSRRSGEPRWLSCIRGRKDRFVREPSAGAGDLNRSTRLRRRWGTRQAFGGTKPGASRRWRP